MKPTVASIFGFAISVIFCIAPQAQYFGAPIYGNMEGATGDEEITNLYRVQATYGEFDDLEVEDIYIEYDLYSSSLQSDYIYGASIEVDVLGLKGNQTYFYINGTQPTLETASSVMFDIQDRLILNNGSLLQFTPDEIGRKIEFGYGGAYSIGLATDALCLETDSDFLFQDDEGNVLMELKKDEGLLTDSVFATDIDATTLSVTSLSATTGILSTANAQTLNVTGNATVNGFNYTASPTLNGASSTESTSTSVAGGIWNGDFSEGGSTQATANGWISGSNVGWYFAEIGTVAGTAEISNQTLKLAQQSGTGTAQVSNSYTGVLPRTLIKVSPSTSYKLSFRYKTEISSSTSGFRYSIDEYSSAESASKTTNGSYITTTVDWTLVSAPLTTSSTSELVIINFQLTDMVGTVYLDDIKLEQVTTHTNNSTTPTVAYPVITGVSSEFVDQQSEYTSSHVLGESGAVEYTVLQSYTATKLKESAVSVYITGLSNYLGNGNLIIEKRPFIDGAMASSVIASVDIESSVINSWGGLSGWRTFPLFSINAESDLNRSPNFCYYLYFDRDMAGSEGIRIGINTNTYSLGNMYRTSTYGGGFELTIYDLAFKTHYAENTRQITLTNSSTGTSTTVDWGDDGLPDGAVVDLYNGTMSWETGLGTQPGIAKFFSLVYNSLGIYPSQPNYFGWYHISGNSLYNSSSASLYLRIPCKYVKDVTTTFRLYGSASNATDLYYSYDMSSWKILAYAQNPGTTYYVSNNIESNGRNVYIKTLGNTSYGTGLQRIYNFGFTATLDTSTIAPLLLAAGSNTINQSVNGGSYKANVAIKSVSGGFQTTLNEANKQLAVLRNAPRSYLETPDKTTNAIVVDNDELVSISGPIQVNGATIMNASATQAYDIALPYNSGGAIGSSWNTYSETRYKNIISDVTEASYASIASRLAGVQSKMVTRKIPDAVKAKFFDAEIEWVTDVVSVTEELKTQVVEPVYEAVKLDAKVALDAKAIEDQLLTAESSPKIVSYVTKEVSVLRSPGEYPRQEFRGWKVRAGVDEATKKQLENLYLKPHPEPIADTAPEAYRVPEGFAWSKWIEESTIYQNWILPQIINEIPQLRKRLEALEASK